MTITEKIAYIQGLFDGLGLDKSESGEARVLSEMLDVMKEMGAQLEEVDATLDEFGEEIDAISDDLSDVEDAVFEDEDDEDDDEEEDLDEDFFEVDCPNCGEKFALSFDDEDECGGECCCGCGEDEEKE